MRMKDVQMELRRHMVDRKFADMFEKRSGRVEINTAFKLACRDFPLVVVFVSDAKTDGQLLTYDRDNMKAFLFIPVVGREIDKETVCGAMKVISRLYNGRRPLPAESYFWAVSKIRKTPWTIFTPSSR